MRGSPVYVGQSFAGGWNTRDAAFEIDFTQARDLLNVTGTVSGALRRRDGSVTFATPPSVLLSAVRVDLGTARYLVAQGGTAFYRIDTGGAVTAITGPTVPTSGIRWAGVQAPAIGGQGPVYLMNATNTPQQWTGTGNLADWTATTGAVPNGQYMVAAGNRIYAAGMTSYAGVSDPGSTLAWSDIGNPRSWPAANFVMLDPNDGDQITGIGVFGPVVIIFKRRKTFVLTNLDTGANRRISAETGCAAHRSIAETPNGTYFLTLDKGVYITNGSSMQPVSDIIRPTLANVVESQRANAAGAYVNNHYYLAVALDGLTGHNDTLLDFDVAQNSWWRHSIASQQLVVWRPVANAQLHSLDAASAGVRRLFVPGQNGDDGASYDSYWTTGWMNPSYFRRRIISSTDVRKRLRQVRFDAQGALSLYIARNFADAFEHVNDWDFSPSMTTFGGTGTFGGAGEFGDPGEVGQGRAPSLGVQNAFSLKWVLDPTKASELEDYVVIMGDRTD
jgi:hypothetical protein